MSVNGNDLNKVPVKGQSKFKVFKSYDWDADLKKNIGVPAPGECFNQPPEPPVNEFEINQKLEVNSTTNFDFVHLATVVSYIGPRLQLRLDGCDNSNDIFELVDSLKIHPIGARIERKKYFAAPLRFRKDAASYNSFCQAALKNAVYAPKSAFKSPPTEPQRNLFKPGMKLEAVDLKHSSNICPATVASVDKDQVTIHLDGWDDSNDYKCSYKSRDLFPVGWCKKTGYPLQYPGPKAEQHSYTSDSNTSSNNSSNLKTEEKEVPVVVKKTTTPTANENVKKESSVTQQSNINKSNVVTVTSNPTLHPKNNALNNNVKNVVNKSTTPKPLTGVEVKTISSAPTGAKLANENPKVAPAAPFKTPQKTFPANNSAIKNSHKPVSVSTSKAPSPAPPALPLPPLASTVASAVTMKSPVPSVSIPSKVSFVSNPSQVTRMMPVTSNVFVSKSANNNNIHITPKSNNIGEQIKQQQNHQQNHQQQNHQQNQQLQQHQQFLPGTTVTNCQVIVSQPSTLQMNNNLNNNRGVKRPQAQMTEMRKPQATFQNVNSFYNIGKPLTPTLALQKSHPIVMQQGHPNTLFFTPISAPPVMSINNNNHNSTLFTTSNQAPIVNGCKKPSATVITDSDIPDPNAVKGWSVDQVINFLTLRLPDFNKYESLFRSHEIDGNAFLLLTNESLIKFMSIKLGYSLKICNIVDRINESDS